MSKSAIERLEKVFALDRDPALRDALEAFTAHALRADVLGGAAWSDLLRVAPEQRSARGEGGEKAPPVPVSAITAGAALVRPRSRVPALFGVSRRDIDAAASVLREAAEHRSLQPLRTARPVQRAIKSALDRVFGLLLLVSCLPLLGAGVLALKIEGTPGPVLFRQERVGRGGRPFTMLKLRTMVADAHTRKAALLGLSDAGPLFKMVADPRVTRVGRVLRRYSLDELPQLWNVVRGDMSLVGPRPPLPAEVRAYDLVAVRRLEVKPGLTGLWQVSARSDLSWEESIRLDISYVDNWSLLLDLRILARTAAAVFRPY